MLFRSNTLVIGATHTDPDGACCDSGAAYIYARSGSTWTLQSPPRLTSITAAINDHFGQSVAVSHNKVLVGMNTFSSGPNSVETYTPVAGVWTRQELLREPPRPPARSDFSWAVATDGIRTLVGAPSAGMGAAYVFGGPAVRLVAVEAVQVIQDWHNSVPLVTGKRTYVRAHFETTDDSLPVVAGVLHGSRDGTSLPDSPLKPLNFGGNTLVTSNAAEGRPYFDSRTISSTLNFQLPVSWLNGTVDLEFASTTNSAGYSPVTCQEFAEAGGTTNDCRLRISFTDVPLPKLQILKIRQELLGGGFVNDVSDADVIEAMQRVKAALPIINTSYFVDTLTIPSSLVTTSSKPAILNAINAWGNTHFSLLDKTLTNFFRIHLGILRGPDIGGQASIPGSAACATLVDVDFNRNSITHEIAHCLGQPHAVDSRLGPKNGQLQGRCGEVADAETDDFPFFFSVDRGGVVDIRPTLGPMTDGEDNLIYGLDSYQIQNNGLPVADPKASFELMSYCDQFAYNWPSVYTYTNLIQAISERYGVSPIAPLPQAAGFAASPTDLLLLRGTINLITDAVTLLPLLPLPNATPPPLPVSGNYALQLLDASDTVLTSIPFTPNVGTENDSDTGSFLILVPADVAIQKLQVLHGTNTLATLAASAHPPTIQILSPNGGEILSDPVTLSWNGSDLDGDALTYTVQYSPDDGATWSTLGFDRAATAMTIPLQDLASSNTGRMRVIASDGFRTATDESDAPFTVPRKAPVVTITGPSEGQIFAGAQAIGFSAASFDREDGTLEGASLQWLSDLDGPLGAGTELVVNSGNLAAGLHTIRVIATDSSAASSTATISIVVNAVIPAAAADLAVFQQTDVRAVPAGAALIYTLSAYNDGPNPATDVVLTNALPVGVTVIAVDHGQVVSNLWVCPLGTLLPGAVQTTTAILSPQSPGLLTNVVTITGAGPDPLPVNNRSQLVTPAIAAPSELHNLAVVKLKSPRKITLAAGVAPKPGKIQIAIQNLGTQPEVIHDATELQGLVHLQVNSLGSCTDAEPVVLNPTVFPITLAPNQKLNLGYTVVLDCVNDPLAGIGHEDYTTTVILRHSALDGVPDTTPQNDVCPRPPNLVTGEKGCGGKLGAALTTDIIVK